MSDHETSTLTARLTSLADELTPSVDPVMQVRAARTRHRRQRRTRFVTGGLVAAAAVVSFGVPTAIGALSAASERGEVAGPGGTAPEETHEAVPGKTPGPPLEEEDARKVERWSDMLDERAELDARLSPVAYDLRAAMEARPAPLSLTAPAAFGRCPDWASALSRSLGVAVAEQRGPVGSGPLCLWSGFPENEDLLVQIEYAPRMTREQMVQQVNSEATRQDCYPTALAGTEVLSALALCEEDARTTWRLRFPDTSESVLWTLTVSVSDRYPADDVPAVMAAVELLDATW